MYVCILYVCCIYFVGPVCFNTTYCGGESFNDTSLSFAQCCFILSGKSFVASTQCLQCPLGMYFKSASSRAI